MFYTENIAAMDAAAEARRVRVEEDLAMLREMAEAGMDLVRGLRAQAADPAASPAFDVGLAYERISRAVRRTLALELKLLDEQAGRNEAGLKAKEDARMFRRDSPAPTPVQARKATVIEFLEDEVEALDDEAEQEALFERLDERLEDLSEDLDFCDRPFHEIVAQIRADLGLPPDPRLMRDVDLGEDEEDESDNDEIEGAGDDAASQVSEPAPVLAAESPAGTFSEPFASPRRLNGSG